MTQSELDWFYKEGGASMFWPEAWRAFRDMLPPKEQKDIITGYHSRLFGASPTEQGRFARAFARIENHYFKNLGFLSQSQQIKGNMHKILDIPSIIVQGRYDMICPPGTAELIHRLWPNSNLVMVSKAGHAMSEPGITAALVKATEQFKN